MSLESWEEYDADLLLGNVKAVHHADMTERGSRSPRLQRTVLGVSTTVVGSLDGGKGGQTAAATAAAVTSPSGVQGGDLMR